MAPVVSFETSPSVLVETEGTVLTFTFQLNEAPPSGGVNVTLDEVNISQTQRPNFASAFLNHLDLDYGKNIKVTGGDSLVLNDAFTGFNFNITSQTATISIPIFNDNDTSPGYNGERNFVFVLRSGQGYTVAPNASQDTVIFRDNPAPVGNQSPVANDDSGITPENQILNGNVLTNDSDPNGDSLTITALNGNTGGIGTQIALNFGALLTLNTNGSYVYNPNGQFNYLNDGQTTNDPFTYTISDGKGGTDTASVFITITGITQTTPINQNPVANIDTASTLETQVVGGNVLSNDGDPDGDGLFVSVVNGTANIGVPVGLASGAILILNADGSYNYNPNGQFNYLAEGQSANDSFNYTISDGKGGIATATVIVTIQGTFDFPPGFDPAQYGASNSDLIPVFGYNLAALSNHYIASGRFENRPLDNFDEFRYLASNTDLIGFYGLNGAGATQHYITNGLGEGRPTTTFSPSRYLLSQPDILAAVGINTQAATFHYITNGSQPPENRDPNLFPADRYIASHPDLLQTYRYNLDAGANHYLTRVYTGIESRDATFSPEGYLALNPDIAADAFYGQSLGHATFHYIERGFDEGRRWF